MNRRRRGLPSASQVYKAISGIPELRYTGTNIMCKICNIRFFGRSAFHAKRHIASSYHHQNLNNSIPYIEFVYDFLFMLSVCNIPQNIASNEHFRVFWKKYLPTWKLPTRRQLQYHLPRMHSTVKKRIKDELNNQKVWLTVDETTDTQRHSVLHVVARPLKRNGTVRSLLLASKRIEKTDAETIVKVIKDAIEEFSIAGITMLVTDGAATMLKVGRMLKKCFPTILHITCLIHAYHLVAETIREKYPMVNNLIASTKKVFLKSPKHIRVFKQLCPKVPLPPQPVITRWGTWLQAVFYYHEYFENVKNVIVELKENTSAAVRECHQVFSNSDIQLQIEEIFTNYSAVTDAISRLQNSHLSLPDSLNTLDNLQSILENLRDPIGLHVAQKLRKVLKKNPDLQKLRSISENTEYAEEIKEYLNYANPTSLDVERSFSKYTKTFSPLSRRL